MIDDTAYRGWDINQDTSGGGHWSAVCNCQSNHLGSRRVSPEEAQANARLIAAAPDLLEACVRMDEWFSAMIRRGELKANIELDATREAIQKALG